MLAIETHENLKKLANRLVSGIKEIKICAANSNDLSVTVSAGLTLVEPLHDLDLEAQLKKADIALYQCKNSGKNGYVVV